MSSPRCASARQLRDQLVVHTIKTTVFKYAGNSASLLRTLAERKLELASKMQHNILGVSGRVFTASITTKNSGFQRQEIVILVRREAANPVTVIVSNRSIRPKREFFSFRDSVVGR
jgi:hypothetical protein